MTLGRLGFPQRMDGPDRTIPHLITWSKEHLMPDDQTLATILTICELMRQSATGVKTAVEAYERAMKDVIQYRRSVGQTEVGGLPAMK
jgi:hypothetical protein